MPVEVVTVGDAPLSERLAPLVLAAREAMVNAAKHSGRRQGRRLRRGARDAQVEVFVRDRGAGFDAERGPGGPARRAQQHRRTGWRGTAARPRSAPRPARAPRSRLHHADRRPEEEHDEPAARVVIVDDHAMFRTGVRAELAAQPTGRRRSAEAADVDEAVAAVAAHQPEVVLLDVHLPGGGGAEVMRRVGGRGAGAPGSWRCQRLRRRRGRDRHHPGRRPRLRHQDDHRPRAGRRDRPGRRRRRGVLAAAGRVRARRVRRARSRSPRSTRTSTGSPSGSAR